jgi:hypothetical protein
MVKLPRRPVSLVTIPDVKDSFLLPASLAAFERRVAHKTGAMPVQEVDRLLAEPARIYERPDDTIGGYAVV